MRQCNCPNSTLGKCRGAVRLNISLEAQVRVGSIASFWRSATHFRVSRKQTCRAATGKSQRCQERPSPYIVTNQHVVDGCVGDIQGNLTGEAPVKLRLVSVDETNDLALL